MLPKIISYLDYVCYCMIISPIPFGPGNFLRKYYFKIKMGDRMGENVQINSHVILGNTELLTIHKNVSIMSNVQLGYGVGGKITLHEGALIGHEVLFVNNSHEFKNKNTPVQLQGYILPHKDIEIGKNVWIGTRAIIFPGVTIGDYAIIGAGAIVTKSIPSNSIAAGVPAKVIKKR